MCSTKGRAHKVLRGKVGFRPSTLTYVTHRSVSVLRNIKKECGGIISKYDQCLSKNTSQPEKCIEALQDLYHCSARVAKQEGIQI